MNQQDKFYIEKEFKMAAKLFTELQKRVDDLDIKVSNLYIKQQQVRVEPEVKPAKNVKDFDWLDNKLNDILAQFEHKHITKEGAKDLLYEFIFEELVNEIQKLKDSSLSV